MTGVLNLLTMMSEFSILATTVQEFPLAAVIGAGFKLVSEIKGQNL